jgi:hypothetical protein
MTSSSICLRSSRVPMDGECWVDTTTVSTVRGTAPS